MARAKPAISANSVDGRILLALRAGRMMPSALQERFPSACNFYLGRLMAAGLVDKQGGRFSETYGLTDAGRAACPSRNTRPEARPSCV